MSLLVIHYTCVRLLPAIKDPEGYTPTSQSPSGYCDSAPHRSCLDSQSLRVFSDFTDNWVFPVD